MCMLGMVLVKVRVIYIYIYVCVCVCVCMQVLQVVAGQNYRVRVRYSNKKGEPIPRLKS